MADFRAKIAKLYRYRILPYVKDYRGALYLNRTLKNWAQKNVDSIEEDPKSIFERGEWDNLLILDACRHDLYEEVCGETDYRITLGAHSREFIEKTFSEGDYSDCVYITANVHFSEQKFKNNAGRSPDEVFHEIFNTFETDWSSEERVVLPEDLIRDAKTAKKLFPDKKLIVHFMQPHHPFVESDEDYRDRDDFVWNLAERDEVPRDLVWRDYRRNLEFVLDEIEDFVDNLSGKTVITSDHGNLAGENDLYHHPYGSKAVPVRKVPWDIVSDS